MVCVQTEHSAVGNVSRSGILRPSMRNAICVAVVVALVGYVVLIPNSLRNAYVYTSSHDSICREFEALEMIPPNDTLAERWREEVAQVWDKYYRVCYFDISKHYAGIERMRQFSVAFESRNRSCCDPKATLRWVKNELAAIAAMEGTAGSGD